MMNKSKTKYLVEAVALYATGQDHSGPMDELSTLCIDSEWLFVCDMLDLVDEIQANSGNGTLWQVEKTHATREKRENRYPNQALIYDTSEGARQERVDRIKAIAQDFQQKGFKFRMPDLDKVK